VTTRTTLPFRADHVGSFLRPKYLLDAREQKARGQITLAELRSLGAAGCTYVQMDDSNLAYLCDPKMHEAARYAPLEQLVLSPQCGFSSTVHGNAIAMEAQAAKLRLVVDVAAEVWGSA